MRVGLLQISAGLDPEANLAAIERLSADDQVDVWIAPEAVMHDFGAPDLPLGPVAQPLDGPFVTGLGELAAKRGATFVAGMFEVSDDPQRPYNTLVVVAPAGGAPAGGVPAAEPPMSSGTADAPAGGVPAELVATYRKAHLYDSFGYAESDRLRRGEPVPAVADVAGTRIGLMTCYDLRFPEHARALVDAGADVLIVPAAWVRGPLKEGQWETLLRARAIENTVYVAAAAQCGRKYCGRTMLVDPLGVPVAALGEAEGTTSGTVSAERIAEVRATNPALTHRRWQVTPSPT